MRKSGFIAILVLGLGLLGGCQYAAFFIVENNSKSPIEVIWSDWPIEKAEPREGNLKSLKKALKTAQWITALPLAEYEHDATGSYMVKVAPGAGIVICHLPGSMVFDTNSGRHFGKARLEIRTSKGSIVLTGQEILSALKRGDWMFVYSYN